MGDTLCTIAFCKQQIKWRKAVLYGMQRVKKVKSKREMRVQQLRSDIANLINYRLSHHTTIQHRVEQLWAEQRLLRAYNTIEIFFERISGKVLTIENESSCPRDLKEAVGSLVYATARCADLPELQELRDFFTHKYGDTFITSAQLPSPDSQVSKQIIEMLSYSALSKEGRLKLMKEVTSEYNVQWDPPSQDLQEGNENQAHDQTKYTTIYTCSSSTKNPNVGNPHGIKGEEEKEFPAEHTIIASEHLQKEEDKRLSNFQRGCATSVKCEERYGSNINDGRNGMSSQRGFSGIRVNSEILYEEYARRNVGQIEEESYSQRGIYVSKEEILPREALRFTGKVRDKDMEERYDTEEDDGKSKTIDRNSDSRKAKEEKRIMPSSSPPSYHRASSTTIANHNNNKSKSKVVTPPRPRSVSLRDGKGVADSLVHPNLPDYDDLLQKFSAFKHTQTNTYYK